MYNVLVTDDEFYVRASIINRIDWASLGFNVPLQAENGVHALEILSTDPVHVLISDVRMPLMDGLTLIAKVRAEYPEILCIILSGYDEFEYARFALRQHVVDYLLKPVDPALLTKLLAHSVEQLRASGVQETSVPSGDSDRIQQIKQYINNHLDKDLSLKTIANQMFLSTSYLSVLFKKRTGSSFSAYVEDQRMKRAKDLLCNRDASISTVAQQVGYADQAYFSRVFSRCVGCSPKTWQLNQGFTNAKKDGPKL